MSGRNSRYITNENKNSTTNVGEPKFLLVICLMDYLVTTECVDFVEFKAKTQNLSDQLLTNVHSL